MSKDKGKHRRELVCSTCLKKFTTHSSQRRECYTCKPKAKKRNYSRNRHKPKTPWRTGINVTPDEKELK